MAGAKDEGREQAPWSGLLIWSVRAPGKRDSFIHSGEVKDARDYTPPRCRWDCPDHEMETENNQSSSLTYWKRPNWDHSWSFKLVGSSSKVLIVFRCFEDILACQSCCSHWSWDGRKTARAHQYRVVTKSRTRKQIFQRRYRIALWPVVSLTIRTSI